MVTVGRTAVAEVAGVVLRLVVDPHVVGDVGGGQQLPTDVAGDLLLVADQVSAQPVAGRERRGARLHRHTGSEEPCSTTTTLILLLRYYYTTTTTLLQHYTTTTTEEHVCTDTRVQRSPAVLLLLQHCYTTTTTLLQ